MSVDTKTLWDLFRDRLRAFVRSRVANDADANDIVQRAFLKMHSALQEGKSIEDPQAWVFAVTRNALRDHYRAESSRTSKTEAWAKEPILVESDLNDASSAELTNCIAPLLRSLEQPYRDALQWTSIDGLTQRAAADKAQISLSGMKSRVQRGRLKLRGLLESCCVVEVDSRGAPFGAAPRCTCC